MKKAEILLIYELMKTAKLTKMEDIDKLKVIKILKEIKSIVRDFDNFKKEILEKLKDDDYDSMFKKLQKWQQEGKNTILTSDEQLKINKYFQTYNNQILECVKEEAEKDIKLNMIKLTDESFKKLIASNDWSIEQSLTLYEFFT